MTAQTILPANTLSGGYDVANSLRFNSGSSDSLTLSTTAGNRTTWTFSTWFKRSKLGVLQSILEHDDSNYFRVRITSGDVFEVFDSNTNKLWSWLPLLRDTSAWYHIVIRGDSTDGTNGNRVRLYINGSLAPTNAVASIDQNYTFSFNQGGTLQIGKRGSTDYLDGYLAETILIDGSALAPDQFGEFDEDSPTIWKPIDVSGLTFGNEGFYLEFKGSGTSANSSGLGADTSGNDHHFTVNNLTAVDQSTDTCTNNFVTLNPLIIFGSNNSAFSEGNLVYDDSRGDWRAAVGTFGASSGKWYYEIKLGGGTYHQVGIVGTTSPTSSANLIDLSQVHGGFSFYNDNGNLIARTDGSTISGWASGNVNTTAQTNDILQVALDMDNKYIYFGKAGTFVKSGDPTSGSTGTGGIDISADYTTGVVAIPGVTMYNGSDGSLNFGSPAFAISSGNSDANGHGNFEYAVPSGYFALCTKNLAEHG